MDLMSMWNRILTLWFIKMLCRVLDVISTTALSSLLLRLWVNLHKRQSTLLICRSFRVVR